MSFAPQTGMLGSRRWFRTGSWPLAFGETQGRAVPEDDAMAGGLERCLGARRMVPDLRLEPQANASVLERRVA